MAGRGPTSHRLASPRVGSESVPPVDETKAEASYRAALAFLKTGQYDQSIEAFNGFLVEYPSSAYADNAQYWLAETRYVQQDFSSALPEFEKVINVYPDSAQVPGAVLKIGFCYYELERWDDARTALERVVREYPDTTAARLAVQRLELISQGPG